MASLPLEFVGRIKQQFPEDADKMLRALEETPKTSVHINKEKNQSAAGADEKVKWYDMGRFLTERPLFTLDPLFHAGCYYPQESSSMIVFHVLNQLFSKDRDKTYLDLCASPGGKSILMSVFAGAGGKIISNEINRSRNNILRENLTKWGSSNTIVTCNEPSNFGELKGYFDCILVDAPCSGEGMFRKDPESRNEWSEHNVQHCSIRQKNILSDILPALKRDGYLIYSTCTFAQSENEDSCRWLVDEAGLECVSIPVNPEWNINRIVEEKFQALQFLPHKVDGEGFFIAVFRKKTDQSSLHHREKKIFEIASKKSVELISPWLSQESNIFKSPDGDLYGSNFSVSELNFLAQNLYITMPGTALGRILHDEFIPAHALALSPLHNKELPVIMLDREQALSYLRGETQFSAEGLGWHLVVFENATLGWVKLLKNRLNNYYPKEWRIRMR